MKKNILFALLFLSGPAVVFAQQGYEKITFDRADTLRGMLRPERTCYDVTFYDLNVKVDVGQKSLSGTVGIAFDVLENFRTLQIDLFQNLKIGRILFKNQPVQFEREGNAVFVHLPQDLPKGTKASIQVDYGGQPTAARNAPWDGGFVWKTDRQGRPWVAVACEGDGASLWWPCKDHLTDEPDSMAISVQVPPGLVCASNGNLRQINENQDSSSVWKWFVGYPINNYNVSVNIGHYAHFTDTYVARDGDSLALDYYVLDYNLPKAKKHFEQVKPMLACYERFFGKYPFWDDGFALIETPYLGMEHQSGIAYGNDYQRGYRGGRIPDGMDWDFLIIHESGHEYFGNAVSSKDHCDMWIHESFTTYMEALYVECQYSFEDAVRYLEMQRPWISNTASIVGPPHVNFDFGSSDHYFKGSWVLHTFRHVVADDERFFQFLRAYYDRFKFTTTTTGEFIEFTNAFFKKDYSKFWQQYLFFSAIPALQYELTQNGPDLKICYRWKADVPGFDMPVRVGKKGQYEVLHPTADKQQEEVLKNMEAADFQVATELFYVETVARLK